METNKLRCQVICLPVDKFNEFKDFYNWVRGGKKFDLYLVSERELKIGDWYIVKLYDLENNESIVIEQVKLLNDVWINDDSVINTRHKDNCKKIEATTDSSLTIKVGESSDKQHWLSGWLPLIPQAFIEAYVKEQGNIQEVMIEQEFYFKGFSKDHGGNIAISAQRIKTRPDNTVYISEVKKSWSKDEVIVLLRKSANDFSGRTKVDFNSWINQNI